MEILEKSNLLSDVLIDLNGSENPEASPNFEANEEGVLAIILLYKNPEFKGVIKPYNLELCGKKMYEWVQDSVANLEVKTVTCDENSNIVSLIKPLLNNNKTSIVLYSDTPLVAKSTIDEILDYFSTSTLNVLKLKRGWVFNTEYIKNAESVNSVLIREFGGKDFDVVHNASSLCETSAILQERILNYHLENGVFIDDKKSTVIDATAIIEPGVKLGANNIIKGETYLGRNVVLEHNNVLINSIISSGCNIKSSYIKNSKITNNMVVGPFETIEEKEN